MTTPPRGAAPTTRAQRAVWSALADTEAFTSAQDIHARLRARGDTVGLTSVYRALQSLSDAGLVDVLRTASGESTWRRCSDGHHHHLVCRSCGATVEVAAPDLERWVTRVAAAHGYAATGHTLEITGTCGPCARR